jgi:medium-chain acyl-[acyl-carrier-protein] hydrolase
MAEFEGPAIHKASYVVRARDCGADGEMKSEALFEVLQEEAGAHADAHGWGFADLLPQGKTWFLARIRLVVARRPRYRERLELRTWSRGAAGLIALRDFVILGEGGDIAARASSSWLLVDMGSKRPLRPDKVAEALVPHCERALEADADKIPEFASVPAILPDGTAASGFMVRPSDLDVNDHVNNTVYVRMLEDALAEAGNMPKPGSIEVNYVSEAFLGDRLSLEWEGEAAAGGASFRARLVGGKGIEYARFRLSAAG